MGINNKSLRQWGDDLNARLEGTPDYAALGGRYAVSSLLGITFRINAGQVLPAAPGRQKGRGDSAARETGCLPQAALPCRPARLFLGC